MLVQLNRQDRDTSVTATDLPLDATATRSPDPVVAVLGPPGRVAGLAAHLPGSWSTRRPAGLADLRPGEIVLVTRATADEVGAARAALPRRTLLVALVDEDAPAELVAAVLTAGADVCVRGGHPGILAGHLVACRRRQVVDRWSEPGPPTDPA